MTTEPDPRHYPKPDVPCACGSHSGAVLPIQKAWVPRWETDRWAPRDKYVFWDPAWPDPPRTCTYCGGVCPSDVFHLLAQGWEIEGTGKCYKAYINPPGSAAHHKQLVESFGDSEREPPQFRTPNPPLKFYAHHCTEEELQRFNHYARAQQSKRP